MLSKGIKKYIFNPVIGLLPFVVYLLLHTFVEVEDFQSIIICLGFTIFCELVIRATFHTKMYSLMFFTSIAAFVFTLIFWIFTYKHVHAQHIYVIFPEIIIVCTLILIRLSQTFVARHFFRRKNVIQKAWLNEFFHMVNLVQYGLTLHLFLVLIYMNLKESTFINDRWDLFIIVLLPVVILCAIGVYHYVRTNRFVAKLRKEEWIPIVTERGEVTGRIAKSVSLKMQNRFLHPVVRVALICQGQVFLQERKSNDILSPGKLDYPFEKYLLYNHEVNIAARNSIIQMVGEENGSENPINFILKYVYSNANTKRLIYLFTTEIVDPSIVKRTHLITGKFWSVKQIENAFADEVFSENFELEFEYVKNMVLPSSSNVESESLS